MVASFPSATHRRLAAFLAALFLAVAALASPFASADDDLKDKQKQVKKQISSAHADLDESSKALREATIALREAQVALGAAQARLAETRGKLLAAEIRDRKMQAKLKASIQALATARAELAQGREDVQVQRDAVGELVAQMYEQGSPDLIGLNSMFEAQGLNDLTVVESTNESLSEDAHHTLDSLKAAEVLLTVKEARVESRKDEVEIQRKAAAEHLVLMQGLERQAEAEEASVRSLVGQRANALATAEKAKSRDRAVLAGLRAQEARITELLKQRALQAAKNANGSGGSSNGYLSFPVNGRITSPYGYRVHPIYGYYSLHNGIDFGAGLGSPLYAAADGVVLESGYDSVYGNYLIIDHGYRAGGGLATRYNHATGYVVGSGQRVSRGQVVGYVGSTGWSTGPHLHFSVLYNGAYVDPINWL